MCAGEAQPMLMYTYGGQRTISRVSLYLPPWRRQGFLLLTAVYTELTHSQASWTFPIIASSPSHCKQAGTANSNRATALSIEPCPQPFTASLLFMKPSLKPQASKLQSHVPTEGAHHWWASTSTQSPPPWNHGAQSCPTPWHTALMAFGTGHRV